MKNANFCSGANTNITLKELGWDDEFASHFAPYKENYIPGRVACRQKTHYDVYIEGDYVKAHISGALRNAGRFPAVGDFAVILHKPEAKVYTIVNILPRKTEFSRSAPGKDGENQVIAANIDTVFIVTAAGKDLSARRLERYLSLVHASGAKPVIIINKADLTSMPDELVSKISSVIAKVPVIIISALNNTGLSLLDPYLLSGKTVALIGSSGVGKSTLINTLIQDAVQDTCEVRESDEKGHHKTTVRQLFILDNGTIVIDNPGLREVGIGTSGAGLSDTFTDIEELAKSCRFSDCRHENEPGCAVTEAVKSKKISAERYENYLLLRKEYEFQKEKSEIGLVRIEKKRWKKICTGARDIQHLKGRF